MVPWLSPGRWQTPRSTGCNAPEWPAGSSLRCSATALRAPPDAPGHAAYLSPQALVNIKTWRHRCHHEDWLVRETKSFLTFDVKEHQAAEGRMRLVDIRWGAEVLWSGEMGLWGVLGLCGEKTHDKEAEYEREHKEGEWMGEEATHSSLFGPSPLKLCSLSLPCSPAWCPPWQPEPSEGFWSPESDGTDAQSACALLLPRSVCSTQAKMCKVSDEL